MSEVELNRENKLCALCQLPSALFCSKCRVTPYCSGNCQKLSWARHKKVCKLNNPTPPADCVTLVEGDEDFDRLYSYIIISGAKKGEKRSLCDTIGRLTGVDDFDPLNNELNWEGFEENTVQGFSHEDQSVYRVYHSEQYTEARTDDIENNLATQFLMKENCRGSFVVSKATSPDLVNSSDANDSSKLEACPRVEDTSIKNSKGIKLLLSRREVWEIAEYRHKCSCEGVVSDRIHRTNMQRKEGLLALKKTDFTYLDSLDP